MAVRESGSAPFDRGALRNGGGIALAVGSMVRVAFWPRSGARGAKGIAECERRSAARGGGAAETLAEREGFEPSKGLRP